MPNGKTEVRKKILARGKYLRMVSVGGWEFVERVGSSGVVAVVAVTDADEIVLTEQFRRSVAARVIDLPAGLIGDGDDFHDEQATAAGRRELIEETGYDAARLKVLGQSPTSPGLTSETVVFVRATSLKKVAKGGGVDGENITVHVVKIATAEAWLRRRADRGAQVDCKAYAGLFFASRQSVPRRKTRKS
jgi:ADP-ribose pyrophosphatase